ncbi:hypothetical protein AAG906_017237 [Vitis piasezkii]
MSSIARAFNNIQIFYGINNLKLFITTRSLNSRPESFMLAITKSSAPDSDARRVTGGGVPTPCTRRRSPLRRVINFVDYSLIQGAPAGHESAETPIGHESNGAIVGEGVKFIVILFQSTCDFHHKFGTAFRFTNSHFSLLIHNLNLSFKFSLINEGPHASTSYECTIMYSAPYRQLVIRPHIVPLLPTFHGMESENPYAHIKEFEDVSEFLKKFFPTHRTNSLKRKISNFSAKENEKFYECWERYMEAINAYPHHGFDTWLLVSYFYDGMSSSMKQLLETMCGGDFMSKNPEEAMDFLSYVAEVSRGWDEPHRGEVGKMKSQPNALHAKAGMYTLNEDVEMKAKFAAMTRRVEELELKKMHEVQAVAETPVQVKPCSICQSYEHLVEECPTIPVAREMFGEQANVIGQFKPNSNASVWQYLQLKLEESSKFFMEAKSTSIPTAGSTISTISTILTSFKS